MVDIPGTQPPAPPAPPPDTVTTSRRHLTVRYALGVDRLLWETEKRPMPDEDAVRAVVAASADNPPADALDIAAALVTIQAMRLDLDALEADVLDAARRAGVSAEAVAAALELPDAASVAARHKMLASRRNAPRVPAQAGSEDPQSAARAAASVAAEHAGQRAHQAANRAVAAGRRREEVTAVRQQATMARERLVASRDQQSATQARAWAPEDTTAVQAVVDLVFGAETHQERAQAASAHASGARINARDSAERVALGLLRAADALERCAARCQEWADKIPGQDERERQRQRAAEYLRAARTYREMAATYRDIGRHLPWL